MKVSPGWIRSEEDSPKFSEPGTPDKNNEAEPPREKNSRFNARKRTTGEEALLFADEQENSLPNGTFAKKTICEVAFIRSFQLKSEL